MLALLLASGTVNVDLSTEQYGVIIMLGGLTAIVALFSGIANIWEKFRPRPPLPESLGAIRKECHDAIATHRKECSEIYASRAEIAGLAKEVHSMRDERRGDVRELRAEIGDMRTLFEQGFKDLLRSLGRVEGKLENE